ncbi:MAG: tetratricopeptide repeat protein, partial [Gammaproteobacteria bacterium]|nr:tetratricopeptide repeat protein [Gammaproteobacteria bacterium]
EYILAVNDLDHVTSESLRSAISHLLEATRLDPNYARAFSTLGRAYFSLLSWGAINESDAIAAARTAASRALDISPDSAEALAVLGMAELFDGNRDAGEQLLKRAIENGPNDTVALNYYARYLRSVARPIEAIEYYQKMLRLDPLSEAAHVALSETYRSVRQYSNAKETITRFKRIDPNSVYADSEIFFMERQQGNFAAAVATMNDSLARVPDDTDPESASQLAQVYLALEMPEEAQRLFDRATEIDALHPTSRSGPLWVNYLLQQNQNDSVRLASELLDDRIDNRFGSRVIALITLYEHGANTGHYDLLLESLDNLYPTLLDDPPHDLDKSLTGTLHAGMALIGNGDVDRGSNYLHFFLNQNEPYREVYGVGLGSVVASLVLGDIQGALDKLADFSQYPYRDFSNGLLVEHSSLFDPIRDEPAFIALLTEYRENAEKQRRILRVMNEDTSER